MKSYETIAQEVLQRKKEYEKIQKIRRKKWMTAAASVCIVAATGLGIWAVSGGISNEEDADWTIKEVLRPTGAISGETGAAAETEVAYEKRWEEKKLYEKFPGFQWNGAEYDRTGGNVLEGDIGNSLGTVPVEGYDIYEDKTYRNTVTLYELSGIDEGCAVAVQFPEDAGYYAYAISWHECSTWGEMVETLSLKENLTFGSVWYRETRGDEYIQVEFPNVDPAKIWEMLLSDMTMENVHDLKDQEFHDTLLSISINLPILGIENVGLVVQEDGYIFTNLMRTGKQFLVGEEKTKSFVDYVMKECEGYQIKYVNETRPTDDSINETVKTEISKGYDPSEEPTVKHTSHTNEVPTEGFSDKAEEIVEETTMVSEETSSLSMSVGMIVKTKNVVFFVSISEEGILKKDSFAILKTQNDGIDLESLNSGDVVEVGLLTVEESYPMQTNVHTLQVIGKGSIGDLPRSVLVDMKNLGYELLD